VKRALRTALIVSLVCAALVSSACNTTKGFGKDLEQAGESLQGSADRHGAK